MYQLFHIPTGTFLLQRFTKIIHVWAFLDENPGYTRSDLELVEYHEIRRSKITSV